MKNKTTYDHSRSNFLAAIIFTIINVVLIFLETDTMFLFSATIPYYFALSGWYWESIFELGIGIVIIIGLLVLWLISKKHVLGLILAFIYFIIDTIFMLWLYDFQFDASILIDILFHVWIMYFLVSGIMYKGKKKENIEEKEIIIEVNDDIDSTQSSTYLRIAEDVKAKIFLEEYVMGKHVVYRRVKSVNELVINGKVYDEYEALVERPHNLQAKINGHLIEVGIAATSQMYISVDKEIIKKKLRLF